MITSSLSRRLRVFSPAIYLGVITLWTPARVCFRVGMRVRACELGRVLNLRTKLIDL